MAPVSPDAKEAYEHVSCDLPECCSLSYPSDRLHKYISRWTLSLLSESGLPVEVTRCLPLLYPQHPPFPGMNERFSTLHVHFWRMTYHWIAPVHFHSSYVTNVLCWQEGVCGWQWVLSYPTYTYVKVCGCGCGYCIRAAAIILLPSSFLSLTWGIFRIVMTN